jgi:hypothetical protein
MGKGSSIACSTECYQEGATADRQGQPAAVHPCSGAQQRASKCGGDVAMHGRAGTAHATGNGPRQSSSCPHAQCRRSYFSRKPASIPPCVSSLVPFRAARGGGAERIPMSLAPEARADRRGSLLVHKGDEADEVDALEGGRECLLAVVATARAPAAGTASHLLRSSLSAGEAPAPPAVPTPSPTVAAVL